MSRSRDVGISARAPARVDVEAKANGANLVFKNESDSREAVVEKCLVKGRKIVDEGQMDARAIDQESITFYGRRTMNINLPSIDDLDQAQYIADFERNRRKTPFGLAQMHHAAEPRGERRRAPRGSAGADHRQP